MENLSNIIVEDTAVEAVEEISEVAKKALDMPSAAKGFVIGSVTTGVVVFVGKKMLPKAKAWYCRHKAKKAECKITKDSDTVIEADFNEVEEMPEN